MNTNLLLRKVRGMAATIIALAVPAVFAEDAYIESDGTTFVSTGWYMNDKGHVEVDYALTDASQPANWSYILGAHANAKGNSDVGGRVGIFIANNANGYYFVAGDASSSSGWSAPYDKLPRDTKRRIAAIDMNTRTYSYGEKGGSLTTTAIKDSQTISARGKYPVALFADMSNNAGTEALSTSYNKTRIYRVRFWTGNTLDRDFTPCVKGGVAGFIDNVSGTFVTAANPSALTASESTPQIPDDGYVESTGKVGVNSRYFFNPKAGIEVEYALTDTTTGQQRIWGMDGVSPMASLYVQGSLNIAFGSGDTFVNSDTQTGIKADTLRHTAIIDVSSKTAAFITGTTTNWYKNAILDTHAPTTTAAKPLGIFGDCSDANGMSYGNFAKAKIYRIKFFTEGNLVHDYLPCVQGGIAGFKDLVDGEFITSDTAGELTYGGNILVEDGPGYIANNGKAYIDTDFIPTPHTRVEIDYLHVQNLKDNRVFSAYDTDKLYFLHYSNGKTNYAWCCMDKEGNWTSSNLPIYKFRRRTFILDPNTDFAGLMTAGYTNYTSTISGVANALGGTYTNDAGRALRVFADNGGSLVSDLRLYGLRIYEAGTLMHDYIPYSKNGEAGLYDQKTGDFKTSANRYALTAGGNVASNGRNDAYLESDSTQGINTGYLMKGSKSRIECDFSFDDTSKVGNNYQQRPFGQDSGGNLLYSLYINGSGKFMFGFGNTFINSHGPGVTADTVRHTAVIDGYHNRLYWITDGVTNNTYDISGDAHNNNSTWPMGIFATPHNQAATSWRNSSKIKLYSLRIYESDALVHEYVPYKKGNVVGLYDTVDKVVKQDARGGNAFVIGGMGVEGAEKWLVESPANLTLTKSAGSTTLSANASGAVSYKWMKNGEAIPGGADGDLAVEWEKGGKTDTYTVTPVYSIFGVETLGEPVSTTVSHAPDGMMFIVR